MSLLSAVGTALSNLGTALDLAGPIASASGVTATNALTAIDAAITATNAYIASLPKNVNTATFVESQNILSNLIVVKANFSSGQSPTSIIVYGGSLFDIAAQYYGDASLAIALMNANNLISPYIPYGPPDNPILTTLVLPQIQT